MIQFKSREDEPKYPSLDFRLRHLVDLFHQWSEVHACPCVLVTDIDTPDIHLLGGPHYRRQAVDLSILSLGLPKVELFADWINGVYDYGRGFHCAVVGKYDPAGEHQDHLHLQVPPPYRIEGRIPL